MPSFHLSLCSSFTSRFDHLRDAQAFQPQTTCRTPHPLVVIALRLCERILTHGDDRVDGRLDLHLNPAFRYAALQSVEIAVCAAVSDIRPAQTSTCR